MVLALFQEVKRLTNVSFFFFSIFGWNVPLITSQLCFEYLVTYLKVDLCQLLGSVICKPMVKTHLR